MGSILSSLWGRLSRLGRGDMQFKIIIVGMSNAGKTTILYKLALDEVIVTEPTIGSNVEEVQHRNLKLQVWDLGGQENLRAAWDAYYANTHAVIFVIDSADDSQVQTSKAEFLTMLVHNELKDAVILIFANKADMPTARDPGELTEIYGLNEIHEHEWKIQPCCALTGDGLADGLDWLSAKLSERVQRAGGFGSANDGRGLHVTKMPENENRANLTDLTIRTENFMASERKSHAGHEMLDEESGGGFTG